MTKNSPPNPSSNLVESPATNEQLTSLSINSALADVISNLASVATSKKAAERQIALDVWHRRTADDREEPAFQNYLRLLIQCIERYDFPMAKKMADMTEISMSQPAFEHMVFRHLPGLQEQTPAAVEEVLHLAADARFYIMNLRELFSEIEGSGCCMDKARHVFTKWVKYKAGGALPVFDVKSEEFYTPKSLFLDSNQPEELTNYMNALKSVLHGRAQPLIQWNMG